MTVLCLVSTIEEKRKDTLLSLSHVRLLLTISLTHTRTHTVSYKESFCLPLSHAHAHTLARFRVFYNRLKNTHSLKKIKRYTQSTGTADGCKNYSTPATKVGLTIKGARKKDYTLFAPTLFSLHFRSVNSVYLAASSRVLAPLLSPSFSLRASTLSLTNQFIIT